MTERTGLHSLVLGMYDSNTTKTLQRGHRGRGRMVVGFTTTCALVPITKNFATSRPAHGEVYSIQLYEIPFGSDLRQICGFPRVLWFPPPIKLTATI